MPTDNCPGDDDALEKRVSVASSGWTDERKAKARKLARKNRFFERAHLTRRRAPAPFLKAEAIQNLGKHAVGFGKAFERRVRALFDKGLTDAAIARALDVGRATVTYRTMHWRKRKRERRLRSPRVRAAITRIRV
jgi:hypothetical protein